MQRSIHDELWTHANALRGLARALVGGQDADDLMQEAAVQALRQRCDPPASLRAWLARVLRHLAGKHHRASRRRERHESRVGVPAAPVAPDRLAEHRDTLQRVTASLLSLPEPYQGTLLLRYFEDLEPAAIAKATGVPLATVKSRLQRGLVMLRSRLEAKSPGADWRRTLTAAFGLESGAPVAAAAIAGFKGVLLMGTGVKLALGGTVAVLAVATLWFLAGGGAPGVPRANERAAAPAPPPVAASLAAEAGVDDRAEAAPASRLAVPAADTLVRGRCVDERGSPLAGCRIALRGKTRAQPGKDFEADLGVWLATHQGFRWVERESITGADGGFSFAFPWAPLHFEVALQRDTAAPRLTAPLGRLQLGETRDLGDLCLPVTCSLRCRVVDTEGAAVRLVWLNLNLEPEALTRRPSLAQEHYYVKLEADGVYATSIVAGTYGLMAFGRTITSAAKLTVPPATASFDANIVVAAVGAALTITGTVTDERQLPLAGVTVYSLGTSYTGCAFTNARGEFVLCRPDGDRRPDTELVVWHEGFAPFAAPARVVWGSREQRLVLRTGHVLEVHVTAAADGWPVEDFALHLHQERDNPARYMGDDVVPYDAADHHADGVARVTGIAPGRHYLHVVPVRADLAPGLAVPVEFLAFAPLRVDVALAAGARRLLRVITASGAPASETTVELIDPRGGDVTAASPVSAIADWKDGAARALRLQRGTTDAGGELLLHGMSGQLFVLRLSAKGRPRLVMPDVALDPAEPLVVTLPRGARLEGTLGPAELVRSLRAACGDVTASATPRPGREPPGFRLVRGSDAEREVFPPAREPAAQVADDGSFVIDAAPAGTWQLALEPWSFDRPGKRGLPETVATVVLADGGTTRIAVDLPEWLPAIVEGQVLWNGAALAEQSVTLMVRPAGAAAGTHGRFETIRTDRDGRFSVRTRAGLAHVSLTRQRETWWHTLWSAPQVSIAAGRITSAVFAIESGAVRLRLLGRDGKPVAGVPLVLLGEGAHASAWARARTAPSDPEGWIDVEGETQAFTVQVLPQKLLTDEAQRVLNERAPEGSTDSHRPYRLNLGRVVPRRGETVSLELQLSPEWYR